MSKSQRLLDTLLHEIFAELKNLARRAPMRATRLSVIIVRRREGSERSRGTSERDGRCRTTDGLWRGKGGSGMRNHKDGCAAASTRERAVQTEILKCSEILNISFNVHT